MFERYRQEKKDLIDKELELYRREGLLKIQEEIAQGRAALTNEWSNIECTYHSTKEKKGVEIARLDAEIAAKKLTLEHDTTIINFLKTVIDSLVKCRIPDVTLTERNKV